MITVELAIQIQHCRICEQAVVLIGEDPFLYHGLWCRESKSGSIIVENAEVKDFVHLTCFEKTKLDTVPKLEQIKILDEIGFRAYGLGLYKNQLCEFVCRPFAQDDGIWIYARLTPGDPSSAERLRVQDVETAETLANDVRNKICKTENYLNLIGRYLRYGAQPRE